ncbi:MAG TPA: ABC transporter ATP-binding protein [Chloroflexota bacterium]|jgi:peptide/nickel transport system ATP-binding protein
MTVAAPPSTIAEVRDLRAAYLTEAYGVHRAVYALESINLTIKSGEILGIAGESGCGKTTLVKLLLGTVTPPLTVLEGSVHYYVDGQDIDVLALSDVQRRAMSWSIVSYIPQGSMHVLNPVRRIRDTFRDFLSAHRPDWAYRADDYVREYLRELGLPDSVLGAFPHQLSGGMRQRVTIALATILAPKLILADEPTTALDVVVQRGVIQLLDDIRRRTGSTLVLVTHDMGVHANLADRVAVVYAGHIVEQADTVTLFERPRHPYTQYLIQSLPKLDDVAERTSIPGRPPALDKPPPGCRFHPRCPYVMDVCRTTVPPLIDVGDGQRAACFLLSPEMVNA